MNDDTIADLKQFISVTVSQQAVSIKEELTDVFDKKIDSLESRLTKKIDELSESVADAIENTNSSADSRLDDHEQRITALEHKPA